MHPRYAVVAAGEGINSRDGPVEAPVAAPGGVLVGRAEDRPVRRRPLRSRRARTTAARGARTYRERVSAHASQHGEAAPRRGTPRGSGTQGQALRPPQGGAVIS